MPPSILMGLRNELRLEDLAAFGRGASIRIDDDPAFRSTIERNHEFMLEKVASGWPIYGATTGFGSSSGHRLHPDEAEQLQKNLYRYHGCGTGPYFNEIEAAAILLVRMNCLTHACSGVSFELLEHLSAMARAGLLPLIRSQGSVGASGDLTPLSYLAACAAGERQVYWRGKVCETHLVFEELGMRPYTFKTREALALMNGTSVMAALAGLAWLRVNRFLEWVSVSTALMVEVWQGPAAPFLDALHAVKPHPGQRKIAARIASLLHEAPTRLLKREARDAAFTGSVQDPYSLRCVPQLAGALQELLDTTRTWIEREINSVNDNPVFLHEEDQVLNGGHFFGGHIAAACDALKAACASVINLVDRQMALLMESKGRLPENLVSDSLHGQRGSLHHGFKAMQISLSALAAEAAKLAMPMSVFSRPTEASNQDVVSMGTIAARDLMQISRLAMDAIGIHCLALRQSYYLLDEKAQSPQLQAETSHILEQWAEIFPMQREDRALDQSIEKMVAHLFGDLTWS